MVWGASHTEYTSGYGLLQVTAEALDTEIAVFLYADARGGVSHKIHWDTGSFQSASWSGGDLLDDPDNRVVNTSEITWGPVSTAWPGRVKVEWLTSADAVNQVYYRRVSGEPTTPPGTLLPQVIYLPLVARPQSRVIVDDELGEDALPFLVEICGVVVHNYPHRWAGEGAVEHFSPGRFKGEEAVACSHGEDVLPVFVYVSNFSGLF